MSISAIGLTQIGTSQAGMQKGQTQTGDGQVPVTFVTPELTNMMYSQKSSLPCSYVTEACG